MKNRSDITNTDTHNDPSSPKLDRKTIEKNRRDQMKSLCFKLASLIPSHHFNTATTSKDMITQQDQLALAAAYIIQLRERIDGLKRAKEQVNLNPHSSYKMVELKKGSYFPVLELRDLGSCIEVVLITGLQRNFMLYEVIGILEEEGAEVVTASVSTVGDRIFHTMHAQVKISRVGVETSRVCQRLQDLIY